MGRIRGIRLLDWRDFSGKSLEMPVAVRVRSWSHVFSEDMNGECTCTLIVAEEIQHAGM